VGKYAARGAFALLFRRTLQFAGTLAQLQRRIFRVLFSFAQLRRKLGRGQPQQRQQWRRQPQQFRQQLLRLQFEKHHALIEEVGRRR
jgi:hypothetical protein